MNFLDLFSGIGGFRLGAEWAGMNFEHEFHSDIEPFPNKVYAKHFPNSIQLGDIAKIDGEELLLDTVVKTFYPDDMAGKLKKLSEQQVLEAVKMYESGMSLADVAQFYSISRQAVWDLLRRRIKLRNQKQYGRDNHFYRGGEIADSYVHNVTEKAIKKGILTPEPCEVCGDFSKMSDGRLAIQAHHDDYNKPLDVRWLCQKHHHEWHKKNTAIRREESRGEFIITGGFP